jgi:ribonuclease 2-5A
MWSSAEDCFFMMQFAVLGDRKKLDLNSLIKTKGKDTKETWAIDEAIIANAKRSYDTSSFGDLTQYTRNKIAHFDECRRDPGLHSLFGDTPEGVIGYFDKHVLKGGDMVFEVWKEINGKVESLAHFWNT